MEAVYPEQIKTKRLMLRPVFNLHVYRWYRVCSTVDEETTRHLSWSPYSHPDEAADFLSRSKGYWEQNEMARYSVGLRSKNCVIGATALRTHWKKSKGVLGLWLKKAHWGNEYSTERAQALFYVGFCVLDLSIIEVRHNAGNERSRRSIEKYMSTFGGERTGVVKNNNVGPDGQIHDSVVYALERSSYQANSGSEPCIKYAQQLT